MSIQNARGIITDAFEGKVAVSRAAEAVLLSGWDFTDPRGDLQKPPHAVKDFLCEAAVEIQMIGDMPHPRRHLFKLITVGYLRALELQNKDGHDRA